MSVIEMVETQVGYLNLSRVYPHLYHTAVELISLVEELGPLMDEASLRGASVEFVEGVYDKYPRAKAVLLRATGYDKVRQLYEATLGFPLLFKVAVALARSVSSGDSTGQDYLLLNVLRAHHLRQPSEEPALLCVSELNACTREPEPQVLFRVLGCLLLRGLHQRQCGATGAELARIQTVQAMIDNYAGADLVQAVGEHNWRELFMLYSAIALQ